MPELSLKRPVGLVVGATCVLVGLSALAGAPMALLAVKPLWYMFGFEVVIVVAAVFGVLIARGRFAEGPGLALACIGGIVGVGSLLANVSAVNPGGPSFNPMAGPVVAHVPGETLVGGLTLYLVLRAAAAGVIAACGAWVVLSRRRSESVSALVRGLVFAAALAGLLGVGWYVRGTVGRMDAVIRSLLYLATAAVALALLAGAVHFVVRAFEMGRVEGERPRQ